jgi:hypothetical protein
VLALNCCLCCFQEYLFAFVEQDTGAASSKGHTAKRDDHLYSALCICDDDLVNGSRICSKVCYIYVLLASGALTQHACMRNTRAIVLPMLRGQGVAVVAYLIM